MTFSERNFVSNLLFQFRVRHSNLHSYDKTSLFDTKHNTKELMSDMIVGLHEAILHYCLATSISQHATCDLNGLFINTIIKFRGISICVGNQRWVVKVPI